MRDAVEVVFPQMEEVETGERTKRWRIPSGSVNRFVDFYPNEIAELQTAVSLFRREGLVVQAELLERLSTKIRALVKPGAKRRFDVDVEFLLETEGLALRPGPRPKVDNQILEQLREGIIASRKMRLHYRSRKTGRLSRQIVCPYGFLYGNRNYLIAYSMNPQTRDYRMYSLSNIDRAEITQWPFQRRDDFSLIAYAERSFGVFQEEPFDVIWKFTPEAARDAREYLFHPTQEIEDLDDGSLIVRFHAGGALEMSWHLFTWGDSVEVLKPKELQEYL